MRHSRFFVATLMVLLAMVGLARRAPAAALDQLLAAAKKEGAIEFYAPSSLTPRGAQAVGDAFNKKYGLNIKLHYSPSGSMGRDAAKVVTQAATGMAPEWDMMVVTDAHHATLWLRKLHETFDYRKLGVDPKMIHYDNGTISFANQIALPAYNKKFLPAKDAPKSWDDLLDPKWKGGKLGVTVATHHWARLAIGAWGEEKTTKYVKALASQKPSIGKFGAVYTRLLVGEILVAATLTDSFINRAKKKGVPLEFAEGIEPVISPAYHAGVLKNAPHPNVAHLLTAFLISPEGQQAWQKHTGQSSAFIPGTKAHNYFQGKQVLFMTQDQAKTMSKLRAKYYKILGFSR